LHLAFNIFFQFRFGFCLEARWGRARFIPLYFIAAIGANFMSCILAPTTISVGASGALFGPFFSCSFLVSFDFDLRFFLVLFLIFLLDDALFSSLFLLQVSSEPISAI
jgi:membrane associated rhomboid family serine protease